MRLFRSREDRMWEFVDDTRSALLAGRDAEFLAAFDPAVVYQRTHGMAEIQRDLKRFRATGIGTVKITKSDADLDDDGADLRLETLLLAGLRPVAETKVEIRLAERDGKWLVTSVRWE
jgi:hypothetical protein